MDNIIYNWGEEDFGFVRDLDPKLPELLNYLGFSQFDWNIFPIALFAERLQLTSAKILAYLR